MSFAMKRITFFIVDISMKILQSGWMMSIIEKNEMRCGNILSVYKETCDGCGASVPDFSYGGCDLK